MAFNLFLSSLNFIIGWSCLQDALEVPYYRGWAWSKGGRGFCILILAALVNFASAAWNIYRVFTA